MGSDKESTKPKRDKEYEPKESQHGAIVTHRDVWNIFDPLIYDMVEKMYDDTHYVISELVNQGILSLEMERADHPIDLEFAPPKRDTIEHQILKGLGAHLLKELGETKVRFEYKRCDVYGHDLKIRIECGHTRGVRLLDSLFGPYNQDNEFWVLPYGRIQSLGNCNLFKFKFNPNKAQEFKNHRQNHVKRMLDYKQEHGHYPEFWNSVLGVIESPFKSPEEALREQVRYFEQL